MLWKPQEFHLLCKPNLQQLFYFLVNLCVLSLKYLYKVLKYAPNYRLLKKLKEYEAFIGAKENSKCLIKQGRFFTLLLYYILYVAIAVCQIRLAAQLVQISSLILSYLLISFLRFRNDGKESYLIN